MQPLRISRTRDHLDGARQPAAAPAVDLSPLTGAWVNFDAGATGILRLEIADRGGRLAVQTFGACLPAPCDWGEVAGEPFTDGVAEHAAVGFRAVYELGFARVMLASYLNKRLLVVDAYTVFLDGSGRSSYFLRDHFYQA